MSTMRTFGRGQVGGQPRRVDQQLGTREAGRRLRRAAAVARRPGHDRRRAGRGAHAAHCSASALGQRPMTSCRPAAESAEAVLVEMLRHAADAERVVHLPIAQVGAHVQPARQRHFDAAHHHEAEVLLVDVLVGVGEVRGLLVAEEGERRRPRSGSRRPCRRRASRARRRSASSSPSAGCRAGTPRRRRRRRARRRRCCVRSPASMNRPRHRLVTCTPPPYDQTTSEPVTASKLSLADILVTAPPPKTRTPIAVDGRGGGAAVFWLAGLGGAGWPAAGAALRRCVGRAHAHEPRLDPSGAAAQLRVLEGHLEPVALAGRAASRACPAARVRSGVRVASGQQVDRAVGDDHGRFAVDALCGCRRRHDRGHAPAPWRSRQARRVIAPAPGRAASRAHR